MICEICDIPLGAEEAAEHWVDRGQCCTIAWAFHLRPARSWYVLWRCWRWHELLPLLLCGPVIQEEIFPNLRSAEELCWVLMSKSMSQCMPMVQAFSQAVQVTRANRAWWSRSVLTTCLLGRVVCAQLAVCRLSRGATEVLSEPPKHQHICMA